MKESFDLNEFIESLLPALRRACRGTITFKPKPLRQARADKKLVEARIRKELVHYAWLDVVIGTFEYAGMLHILFNGVSEIEVPT